MTDAERRARIQSVLGQIDKVCIPPKVPGARMAGRAVFMHLVHLCDLFDNVQLLLARARALGALVIGRSMFEASLMLGAMEPVATRDAIVHRWFQDSNNRSPGLIRAFEGAGIETDVAEKGALVQENNAKLASARIEHGVEKLPNSFDPDLEAVRQDRAEDIPNWLLAHEFAHGGYQALRYRVTHHHPEERSSFHLDIGHDVELLEAAANFAGRSMLLGHASACRILEVPAPELLPALLELVEFPETGVEAVE
jgi:hypothetical protein